MSFGRRNAAQTFQRFWDEILKDLDFCFAYIDDILVFSRSPQEHDQQLRILFNQLQIYGTLLNPSKCFPVPEISFLGYKISSMGTHPLPERITDLQAYPPPKTVSQLRRFLGMPNFYRVSFHTQPLSKPLFMSFPALMSRVPFLSLGATHSSRPSTSAKQACLELLSCPIHIQPLHSPWSRTLQLPP